MAETLDSLPPRRVPNFISDSWVLLKKVKVQGCTLEFYEVFDNWRPKDAKVSKKIINTGPSKKKIDWDNQPLGKIPDKQIAEELGVTESAVSYARKKRDIPKFVTQKEKQSIDWGNLPLGEVSDVKIAKQLNISIRSVGRARRRLGIAAHVHKWEVDWNDQPLGRMTDADLAKKIGVSVSAVANARIRRGITRFDAYLHRAES